MALAHSKLTAQGQISVPAKVRSKLGVGPGGILDGQVLVVEEHLNGSRDRARAEAVHGAEYPYRFSQDEARHPRSRSDEVFRGRDLSRVVPRRQANQHIRIKGAHVVP